MALREKKNLIDKVMHTITTHNLIETEDKLVLGVSGGPDSICMLDILLKIRQKNQITFDFVVAHVNHMIREEAIEDEQYVKSYCEKNKIQFYAKGIDVQKIANTSKMSTEEAGRNARYAFFNEVKEQTNANKIAIAHNKNDKIETIIMNELRGCGIAGLKGIEPQRDNYIRPMIECERKEIEEYCLENELQPRIDKTNFENIYTRNKIRNIVIPYIEKEFNPNIIKTIDRLSELVTEQEEYIQKQVKNIYQTMLIEEKDKQRIVLDLAIWNQQEKVIKSNIILYTITRLCHSTKGIEKIHIEDIIKLCNNHIGNKFLMPNKHIKVFIKNHKAIFSKED